MRVSSTSTRLLVAFGSVVLLVGAASVLALRGLDQVHEALHGVMRRGEGVRRALDLTVAVREQYAHLAHTIILGNDTHATMFADAGAQVAQAADALETSLDSAEQRRSLVDIRRSSAALGELFREDLLPAVLAADVETVRRKHHEALAIVDDIQGRSDALAKAFEASIEVSEAHAGTIQHGAFFWTGILLGGAVLGAVAMGLYIARSVARPVSVLERGALRLAAGDLETKIAIDSHDEFGRLAAQFNSMTASLREHQERLVQTEKLAGIGRLAAGVAHEINNPLTVILGYVRLLRRKAEGALAEDLAVVEDETVRCQEIVRDLLELARPQASSVELVPLRDLVVDVLQRLREANQLGDVSVEVTGDAQVEASAARLRQVTVNLLRNAVDAAGPGGRVRVELAAEAGDVRMTITDSGPGIAAQTLERLFEPFVTTKAGGTGLGLAVSQAIVRAHGGRIEAENASGTGARFTVRLPSRIVPVVQP